MDVIIQKGRANKIVIKEFNFNPEQADISNTNKRELQVLFDEKKNILLGTSKAAFSELFICLAHLKAMRVYVEGVLRFGVPAHFIASFIQPQSGKDKRILKDLTLFFLKEGENPEMYGSKEESEDSEDFFPYVFIPLGIPSVH